MKIIDAFVERPYTTYFIVAGLVAVYLLRKHSLEAIEKREARRLKAKKELEEMGPLGKQLFPVALTLVAIAWPIFFISQLKKMVEVLVFGVTDDEVKK